MTAIAILTCILVAGLGLSAAADCYDSDRDCYLNKAQCRAASKYNGNKATTLSGKSCQKWKDQSPHAHQHEHQDFNHNYCRNPDMSSAPWCYTTDPSTRWEYCFTTCGPKPEPSGECACSVVHLWRTWSGLSHVASDHAYTTFGTEIKTLRHRNEWKYGLGFCTTAPVKGLDMIPIYRGFNAAKKDHWTTPNKADLEKNGYKFEGIQCWVMKSPKGVPPVKWWPVFDMYNTKTQDSFLTRRAYDKNVLTRNADWKFRGLPFFIFRNPDEACLGALPVPKTDCGLVALQSSHSGTGLVQAWDMDYYVAAGQTAFKHYRTVGYCTRDPVPGVQMALLFKFFNGGKSSTRLEYDEGRMKELEKQGYFRDIPLCWVITDPKGLRAAIFNHVYLVHYTSVDGYYYTGNAADHKHRIGIAAHKPRDGGNPFFVFANGKDCK